ncbi:MAG: hypothetical protein JNL62_13060 [Bryobacterales bacterium]|nr:hypothetical protein [Bryobacterales bacterium]
MLERKQHPSILFTFAVIAFAGNMEAAPPSISFGTYIGSPSSDRVYRKTVDSQGNLYVIMDSRNVNLPETEPRPAQITRRGTELAAKFAPNGKLVYATWLPADMGTVALHADAEGHLYIALIAYGTFNSVTLASVIEPPFVTPFFGSPGLLMKLDPSGTSLILACRLPAIPSAIAADAAGNVFFVSNGSHAAYPPTQGAFRTNGSVSAQRLVKLNPSATRILAATLLENDAEYAVGIAIDRDGNPVVAGSTGHVTSRANGALQLGNNGVPAFLSNGDGQPFRPLPFLSDRQEPLQLATGDHTLPRRLWATDPRQILYRSDDFGESWHSVTFLPARQDGITHELQTFLGHPQLLKCKAGSQSFLSKDGGQTWSNVIGRDFFVLPEDAGTMFIWDSAGRLQITFDGLQTTRSPWPSALSDPSIEDWLPFSHRRVLLSFRSQPISTWSMGEPAPRPIVFPGTFARYPSRLPFFPDPFQWTEGYVLIPQGQDSVNSPIELHRISLDDELRSVIPGITDLSGAFIVADSARKDTLYAGNRDSLLRSTDAGRSWAVLPADIPLNSSRRLFLDAGAHGRMLVFHGLGSDAFFTRFSSDLSDRLGSTTFGRNGRDVVSALAITPKGDVVIAGLTASTDWRDIPGAQPPLGGDDVFLAIISLDGTSLRAFRTLGTSAMETASDIFIDHEGNIVFSGATFGRDLPVSPDALASTADARQSPSIPAAFFSVFDPDLIPLYTSAFPGNAPGRLSIVGQSAPGRWWIVGSTASSDLPTPDSSASQHPLGAEDIYIGMLNR